jgi:hypothetical protein
MPRPPLLPVLDWGAVFLSGRTYRDWLAAAEDQTHADRMEALRVSLVLDEDALAAVKGLSRDVRVVAIAEDWCGDVVRFVPVLQRLADESGHAEVRYLSREQRLDVLARFLTNGGEALPKFVFFNDAFVECGNWGPMPASCRDLVARGKAVGNIPAARKLVADRYAADGDCREAVAEMIALFRRAAATAV